MDPIISDLESSNYSEFDILSGDFVIDVDCLSAVETIDSDKGALDQNPYREYALCQYQNAASGDTTSTSVKRRRIELDHSDSVFESNADNQLQTKPSDSHKIYRLPTLLLNAINGGDISSFSSILNSFTDQDCLYQFYHGNILWERKGNNANIELMKALMATYPDLISTISKTSYLNCGNVIKIVTQSRVQGTRLHREYYNRFFGLEENAFISDYMFDPTKTPSNEIENQKKLEREAYKDGKKIKVFVKVFKVTEFDRTINKVRKQWLRARLSSLRIA